MGAEPSCAVPGLFTQRPAFTLSPLTIAHRPLAATAKSPRGKPVPIADVQAAMDMLASSVEIAIDVPTVGYRSAFIGAVLATLPGATVLPTSPPRVTLRSDVRK